jgi:hypothetical protein
MRIALGLTVLLMLTIGILAVPPCRVPAFAQQRGCCKERDSLSSRTWRQNGLSFQNCQRLNDKRDGDNVAQPAGFVWWDGRCS